MLFTHFFEVQKRSIHKARIVRKKSLEKTFFLQFWPYVSIVFNSIQFIEISSSLVFRVQLTKKPFSDQLYASKIERSNILKLLFDFIFDIKAINKTGYTL